MTTPMTEEELDEARAREAWEAALSRVTGTSANTFEDVDRLWRNALQTAARLAREGWVPTDPDLIEAREIAAQWHDAEHKRNRLESPATYDGWHDREAQRIRNGERDGVPEVRQNHKCIKRGRELALSKASQP